MMRSTNRQWEDWSVDTPEQRWKVCQKVRKLYPDFADAADGRYPNIDFYYTAAGRVTCIPPPHSSHHRSVNAQAASSYSCPSHKDYANPTNEEDHDKSSEKATILAGLDEINQDHKSYLRKDYRRFHGLQCILSTGTSPSFVMAAKYPYPSNINVANFVSIKLSHKNYLLWKTQMLGLIESQDMMGFIEGQFSIPTSTIEIVENGEARSVPNPEFLA
ncbi:hypothetical protein EJ110_NYTH34482 [Nymphaea thermarum]|nr:hypothetical protein EJ110_NYTH34482 [Nymphaea thermarum]